MFLYLFLRYSWLAKPLGRLRSNLQNFKHKSSIPGNADRFGLNVDGLICLYVDWQ